MVDNGNRKKFSKVRWFFIVIIDIDKNTPIPENNEEGKNNINGIFIFYIFMYHGCDKNLALNQK